MKASFFFSIPNLNFQIFVLVFVLFFVVVSIIVDVIVFVVALIVVGRPLKRKQFECAYPMKMFKHVRNTHIVALANISLTHTQGQQKLTGPIVSLCDDV